MKGKRSRVTLFGALALALCASLGMTTEATAAKKKSKLKLVDITKAAEEAVPDGTATTNGRLASTIEVGGKKLKGTKVRDVNVTMQTIGSASDAATELAAVLTAPNGATTWLFSPFAGGLDGQSVGPLTLDDESSSYLSPFPGPAANPETLTEPYAGTAQPFCYGAFGGCSLSTMDNGRVTGTWTLKVYDLVPTGVTSTLSSWRLTVIAGKQFAGKPLKK